MHTQNSQHKSLPSTITDTATIIQMIVTKFHTRSYVNCWIFPLNLLTPAAADTQ